jgi:hypothetical protein
MTKNCGNCVDGIVNLNNEPCHTCLLTDPPGRARPLWRGRDSGVTLEEVKRLMAEGVKTGKIKIFTGGDHVPDVYMPPPPPRAIMVETNGQMRLF